MVLQKCNSCLVYGTDGKPLSNARVVATPKKVSLYFQSSKLKDARIKVPVDFFDSRKGYIRSFCELVIRRNPNFPETPEFWMADCDIKEVYDVIQRQCDVRVEIDMEMEFFSETRGGFFGTIKNISAGGLRLYTTQAMGKHEVFSLRYKFKDRERTIEAMTLWAKSHPGKKFSYGCKFVNLPDGAEEDIRRFVYQMQMKQEKEQS